MNSGQNCVRFANSLLGAAALVLVALAGQSPAWAQVPGGGPGASGGRGGGQARNGMHIYIYAGLKSHGEGQHDYPQFLADWSKVLTDHGAIVDGALHPPSAEDLAQTDVVVMYKGDVGLWMTPAQNAVLEAYVKRGGGIVSFHDSLCGPDPAYFATTYTGGAKKHGEVNYTLDAPIPYTVMDKGNPIMKDFPDFTLADDESFYLMTWAKDPGIHILANASIADTPSARGHVGEVVPQMWTYEHTLPGGQPARAYVWMQGHTYSNFAKPEIQKTLLRGIAWAGKRPVEELVAFVPQTGRGGGRGGSGRGGFGGSGRGGRAAAGGGGQ